jgi:adenine-specific DNA-methyltransferase
MEINLLNLRNSINKAYLKVKPNRTQIETFKKNIKNLFDQIKDSESEEFHKNIISEFLKNTYYSPNHYINTKGRSDLVIHNGKDSNSTVGVLFEVKKPGNKSEMPTCENINSKAFQELILYYLRERITNKNIEIKHLVITNIIEWFIFNANDFEKFFANDKSLVKQFIDFQEGRLSGTNTDFFYKNIAEPFCNKLESPISITHFDIRDSETTIKNADREDDNKLITLYKVLSPEHLLKLPFANDSNTLDKTFYNELLHIIGLEETKEGSKKIIGRKDEKKRNPGSLIENSITILKSEDCLSQLPKLYDYGNSKEEQVFNIALELAITWINRVLFLKLLEGQLIKYNNGDKAFRFLNIERIHDYDELNKLFFQVLAVKENDRSELIKQKFSSIPYLNSSLFEPSDLEHKTIRINSLDDHSKIPVLTVTVLKDKTGKKQTGEIDPIQYLFEFLDSYDFSSEGSEDIQEENKTLINASVLGLIFEKINGYKDGSFFTPGFITMYMCHETIRRAIVQKFNELKSWKCETISDVYNKIEDINEANRIVNSIKICDPAVGSGHFLVSALNEIISIKSELKILTDREGKKLREYTIEVINDELIITDEQSKLFEYNPKSKESQRVQEALFQEKQKIIENCLFGVDINLNSVKICRLRLWIELLKNAYYKPGTRNAELETLPNIDINIKCGNSLISRYPLDADIKIALKSSKWNVDNYREAVMTYRNAQSKDEKRSMEQLISKIKNDFETEVSKSDKRFLKLNKLKGELLSFTGQSRLFELTKTQKDEWNRKVKKITVEIKKFETEIEEINNNCIYENAFEWRFEFPEVLDNEGDFVGFDVVIGNPPYIRQETISQMKPYLQINYSIYSGIADLYVFFVQKGINILHENGSFNYILPNKWMRTGYGKKLRKWILQYEIRSIIDFGDLPVFEEATIYPCIMSICKSNNNIVLANSVKIETLAYPNGLQKYVEENKIRVNIQQFADNSWTLIEETKLILLKKIKDLGKPLTEYVRGKIYRGVLTGMNEAFVISSATKNQLVTKDPNCVAIIKPFLIGRDIKKYQQPKSDKFVIFTRRGIQIDSYPVIREYLDYYRDKLEPKPKNFKGSWLGRKEGTYKWYEIQDSTDYCSEFEKTKIIWPGITSEITSFAFDQCKYYGNDNTNLIISDDLVLLGILNSKISKFYLTNLCDFVRGGFIRLKISYVGQLPIVIVTPVLKEAIERLVSQILNLKKSNSSADSSTLELEIDRLVYELYGLTEDEIRIVENST